MIIIINYVKYGDHYIQQQKSNYCTGNNSGPTINQSTTHVHRPRNNNDELQQKMNQTTVKTVKKNTTKTTYKN